MAEFGERANPVEQRTRMLRSGMEDSLITFVSKADEMPPTASAPVAISVAAEHAAREVAKVTLHHEAYVAEHEDEDDFPAESDEVAMMSQVELTKRSMTRWIVSGTVMIATLVATVLSNPT